MGFYRYDERTSKNREETCDMVAEFLSEGGAVTKVPDAKIMKRIRRTQAASKRREEEEGQITLIDMSEI